MLNKVLERGTDEYINLALAASVLNAYARYKRFKDKYYVAETKGDDGEEWTTIVYGDKFQALNEEEHKGIVNGNFVEFYKIFMSQESMLEAC